MKRFKEILSEAKLTYDQAWNLHRSEFDELKQNRFEIRSQGQKNPKKPSGTGYGFHRGLGSANAGGESRSYDLWVTFDHDNTTRINDGVETILASIDGPDLPKTVDRRAHKNIKAAITYVKKLALAKIQEDFAEVIEELNYWSIEDLKRRGSLGALYSLGYYLQLKNDAELINFVNKIKKANPRGEAGALAIAKKFIKKI